VISIRSLPRQPARNRDEPLDGGQVVDLLTRSVFEPYAQSMLAKLNGGAAPSFATVVLPDHGEGRTFDFPNQGIRVQVWEGKISSVSFYGDEARSVLEASTSSKWSTFRGRLPLGLSWDDTRWIVRSHLGQARPISNAEGREEGDGFFVGKLMYMVRYSTTRKLTEVNVLVP